MFYTIPFPYLFIYWSIIIACSAWCVLGIWKSIIIDFIAIWQNSIYILLGSFMNRSITGIIFNRNLPPLIFFFTVFEHMCLNTLYGDSNPTLNSLQLIISEVLMFHESTQLLPSGESYDLSMGDNDLNEIITLVLVGIPVRNKFGWFELVKGDLS